MADLGHGMVKVLHPESLRVVGKIGADKLKHPRGLAFDKKGRLLVTDPENDRIAIFTIKGTQGSWLGAIRGGLDTAKGVIALPDGRVVVSNASSHSIKVFFLGRLVDAFGYEGGGAKGYLGPHALQADDRRRLFITDPGHNRIHILDAQHQPEGMMGPPHYNLHAPKHVAFDEVGRFYVADEYDRAVKIFDRELRQGGGDSLCQGRAGLWVEPPKRIVAQGGKVWIADARQQPDFALPATGDPLAPGGFKGVSSRVSPCCMTKNFFGETPARARAWASLAGGSSSGSSVNSKVPQCIPTEYRALRSCVFLLLRQD